MVLMVLAGIVACGQNQTGRATTNERAHNGSRETVDQAKENQDNQPSTQNTTSANGSADGPGAQTMATNAPASAIPDFTFYILKSGIRFERENLEKDHRHVFILFDPGCTYCQHEARDIGKNLDKFEKTSFYFVSMNDPALMSTFFATYAKDLENQPNVHMLYDRNIQFVNRFHVPSQFPATYVYDSNQLLKTYWNGVKSAQEIVNAITE